MILAGGGQIKLDDRLFEVGPLDAIRVAPEVVRAFEAGPDGLSSSRSGPITTPTASSWTTRGSNELLLTAMTRAVVSLRGSSPGLSSITAFYAGDAGGRVKPRRRRQRFHERTTPEAPRSSATR